jgi:hypothetical protein
MSISSIGSTHATPVPTPHKTKEGPKPREPSVHATAAPPSKGAERKPTTESKHIDLRA